MKMQSPPAAAAFSFSWARRGCYSPPCPDPGSEWRRQRAGGRPWPLSPPVWQPSPSSRAPDLWAPGPVCYSRPSVCRGSPLPPFQSGRAHRARQAHQNTHSQTGSHGYPRPPGTPLSRGEPQKRRLEPAAISLFYKPSMCEDPWAGLQPVIHAPETDHSSGRPVTHCPP